MYEEYDSVRFLERFFLSPDFLGFFSDFLAGVFLAGGMIEWFGVCARERAGPGGVSVKAAGSSGRRPRAAAPHHPSPPLLTPRAVLTSPFDDTHAMSMIHTAILTTRRYQRCGDDCGGGGSGCE